MRISQYGLFLSLVTIFGTSIAQVIPDAGTLERDIEQHRELEKPAREVPFIDATEVAKPATEKNGVKVFVRAFSFKGNKLFSHEQLESVLAPYMNKKLSFSQIYAAAHSIAAYYREAGWLARATLPKQDVTDGVITIRVIEARFAGARIKDRSTATRIDPDVIEQIINADLPVNQPINIPALERGILIADDLPGVNVSGALRAGEQPAETALQLSLSDEPLVSGAMGINNYGSRTTGRARQWANLNLNSPFKRGDLFTSSLVRSRGSDYIQLNYSQPTSLPGLRLGAKVAYMEYELVSSEFAALDAKGDFKSFGINASYPLIRSHQKNLSLTIDFTRKKYSNEALSTTQSNYSIDGLVFSLAGSMPDKLGGSGINSLTSSLTLGNVRLGARDVSENVALEGSFNKLTFGMSRLQFIAEKTELLAVMAAQVADQHLDSSERFYLGGANDVRAYPNSEASGAQGWRISLELRRRLPHNFTLTGFYDMGRVYNKNASPDYGLKGAGIKTRWQNAHGVSAEVTWSRRMGRNPNPTATGNDQDGSLDKNRLWLSLSWGF